MTIRSLLVLCFCLGATVGSAQKTIVVRSGGLSWSASAGGARYGFAVNGKTVVAPDHQAGLMLAGKAVTLSAEKGCGGSRCVLEGTTAEGRRLRLTVALEAHHAELIAEAEHVGDEVRFATAGAAPAYGLADHAVEQKQFSTLANKQFNTDVTGFADDTFLSGQGQTRLVSNFLVYPQQGFAELLIDPYTKIVRSSQEQIVQGVAQSHGKVSLHYFFGNMHEIYAAYRTARIAAGYRIFTPKEEAFGVGWEAFGALAWETDEVTVRNSIDKYLAAGFPLRWIVIGSGFWPAPTAMHETTSFGYWDKAKYPDPEGLLAHFHDEHLKTMLGLRITFITDGPYAEEGLRGGHFLMRDGKAEVFTGGWPKSPYYLLDAHKPEALKWYMGLVAKWNVAGVDGYKEDFYGYGGHGLRDDKVDPTNDRLMEDKKLVIERNGYLSSNGDLHRINDFNYNQDQDRGPVNSLALAYSGFPLVYPDIVGGTFGENHFSTARTRRMETYMMRNAQWAALHSSMGMGEPPWSFSPEVAGVMLSAAKLHARFAPYFFSNGRRFAADGYPWTMTPLPIAFPDDPMVYGHENASDRRYEWMVGDALLAVPLYGNDYGEAETRDVYLPEGRWMDFDTGTIYEGKKLLKNFAMPTAKTPVFVGGSGVTLEDARGKVGVVVYPVALHASAKLLLSGSEREVTVRVIGLPAGVKWSGVRVEDARGKVVAATANGFGFRFMPEPGMTYTVRAQR